MAGNAFPPQIRPTQATKAAYFVDTVAVAYQSTDARSVSNSAALERSDPCGPGLDWPFAHCRHRVQAPICYQAGGQSHGTLKGLSSWCAERRAGLLLHFAKTGTSVTRDINSTVDTWIAGGLQFANSAAYSYVVLVGSGSTSEVWAQNIHAAQVGVPLAAALLNDLEIHSRKNPTVAAISIKPGA